MIHHVLISPVFIFRIIPFLFTFLPLDKSLIPQISYPTSDGYMSYHIHSRGIIIYYGIHVLFNELYLINNRISIK